VQDLDGEVLTLLTKDLLVLLLEYLAGPVVRVDDVVADREIDVLDDASLLQGFQGLFDCFGNGVLRVWVFRSAGSGPRG